MIWGYSQYAPVLFTTVGAAIVSCSVAWTNASGYGYPPALGLLLIALGVELGKPFAVQAALRRSSWFWIAAVVCVLGSSLAELQLLSRTRADYADKTSRVDVARNRSDDTRDRLVDELNGLKPARSVEELEPLIRAAGDCLPPVPTKRRVACENLPALKSEAARSIRRAELARKIAEGDDKAELQKRGKTEEGEAIAAVAGWFGRSVDARTVDQSLALLMVLVFQLASVGAAAVAQPGKGGQTAGPEIPEKPVTTALPLDGSGGAKGPEPSQDTRHELVITFLRGKGGAYDGSFRAMAETLGYSRRTLNRVLDELQELGIVETTKGGPVRLKQGVA